MERKYIATTGTYCLDIIMTMDQASQGSHMGQCYDDIVDLFEEKEIKEQLEKMDKEQIKKELHSYGAWDDEELKDEKENLYRLLWILCGNIVEGDYDTVMSSLDREFVIDQFKWNDIYDRYEDDETKLSTSYENETWYIHLENYSYDADSELSNQTFQMVECRNEDGENYFDFEEI